MTGLPSSFSLFIIVQLHKQLYQVTFIFMHFYYFNHYFTEEPVTTAPVVIHFGREARVKELLDSSFNQISMGVLSNHIRIMRFPGTNWQLTCEATTTSFTCRVQAARLKVAIFVSTPVSHRLTILCFNILKYLVSF